MIAPLAVLRTLRFSALGLFLVGAYLATGCGAQAQTPAPASGAVRTGTRQAAPAAPGTLLRDASERAGIDVLHYDVDVDLRGEAGTAARRQIIGRTRITLEVRGPATRELALDLVGLRVDSVRLDGLSSAFASEANTLVIPSREAIPPGRKVVEVFYRGTPADGLFFDESLNSVPAAFADNWPNRARWWFPANDHPSDKATVTFTVRTQPTLRVVANGAVADSAGGIWRWTTAVPIPSYTMVIGVAPFQRAVLGRAACGRAPAAANGCVEVSVWGLPGDSAFAVRRFARAVDMVEFYAERVGPFPYEKLAHVQSTSRFGGMENASAIFYAREPWSRGTMGEGVIAHETAHQWFGDSVTEYEWHDLWLSEGFASYFGPLYFESRDGPAAFSRLMASAKESYLRSQVVGRPIVGLPPDRDLFSLLNENNYEKAAWVLHMLRKTLGDSTFFSGVRRYYDEYRNGSATTADFRRIMEEVGAQDLGWFFDQWLHHPGYPQLDAEWSTRPVGGQYEVQLVLRQQQAVEWPTFRLPLDLVLRGANGTEELHRIDAVSRTDTFRIRTMAPVSSLAIDPNEWVLKTLQLRSP